MPNNSKTIYREFPKVPTSNQPPLSERTGNQQPPHPLHREELGQRFHPRGGQIDWVLGKYTEEDMKQLQPAIDLGVEIIKSFVLLVSTSP